MQIISSLNRFKDCKFTDYWRNYAFAQKACQYCSDFWGVEADVSAKDAWGPWSSSPKGTNIVFIHNPEFLALTKKNPNLFRYLKTSEAIRYEYLPIIYKQKFARYRINKQFSLGNYFLDSKLHEKNIDKSQIDVAKIKYARHGKLFNIVSRLYFHFVRKCIEEKENTLLILGGYGYGNVGDEAQLSYCVEKLHGLLPGHILKVMSPDPKYTYQTHNCLVGDAPRLAFFDVDRDPMYSISHVKKKSVKGKINARLQKIRFILRSNWLVFNALLINKGLYPFLITVRQASLLYEIQKCVGIFYDGGGYLTGETLSRLWDAFAVIRIAKIFKKRVFISGQTIGLWNSSYTKSRAKKIFSKCDLIATRDHKGSIGALHELGFSGNLSLPVCDDALFLCNSMSFKEVSQYLGNCLEKSYVTLNIQTWGLKNQNEKDCMTEKVIGIIKTIHSITALDIVLVSMTPPDEEAINLLLEKTQLDYLHVCPFIYDFKVIRAVIAFSKICITMKHHPIIFAMGECVPVISLIYDPYYKQKNEGALSLFGQGNEIIDVTEDAYLDKLSGRLNFVLSNFETIVTEINHNLLELKARQNDFYNKVRNFVLNPEL